MVVCAKTRTTTRYCCSTTMSERVAGHIVCSVPLVAAAWEMARMAVSAMDDAGAAAVDAADVDTMMMPVVMTTRRMLACFYSCWCHDRMSSTTS